MNPLELREMVGDRTYESGRKLLMRNAVTLREKIDGRLSLYKVDDGSIRNVAVWNRDGNVTIECGCTSKEMGCHHCAAVCLFTMDRCDEKDAIRKSTDELASISFDPSDYLDEAERGILMTRFYDFIQKKIDKKIKNISRSIDEFSDGDERIALYRMLWNAVGSFPSPHDEWSKDTITNEGDMDFWDE